MYSHGKTFPVPTSRASTIAALAIVTCWAAVLGILTGCKTADEARLQPNGKKDATITAAIQAKLASDSDLSPLDITVTTNDSVVTLKGRVSRADTRDKAERYARDTDGVLRVIDLVKVGDRR